MMTLIDFEREHFSVLRGWLGGERELVQWGGPDLSFPVSDDELEQMRAEAFVTLPKRLCWMAVDADQALVGHIQLVLDWRHGVARIGRVIIAPDHRGKGLAGPLLRAVVERAFSYNEIERVELNVYTWNAPAIRTYAKVGFVPEGVRRSSVQVGDERWDTAIMGMLRAEWEAM